MRKLNTLLTALALTLGLTTGWAQEDVTSKITNADFSSTDGWTAYVSNDTYTNYGNGLIGTYVVNSNGGAATTDGTHLNTEYCFGMEARWDTNFASYYQEVTLAAGTYTLSYDLENTNTKTKTATSNYTSYCYVSVGDTKYTDDAMEWTSTFNTWTTHTINFTLDAESTVKISLGYYVVVKKVGGDGTPCLYASHLKLQRYESLNIKVNDAEMTEYDSKMPEYSYTITNSEGKTCEPSEVLSTLPTLTATYTNSNSSTAFTTGSAPGIYSDAITATGAVAKDGYVIVSNTAGTLTIKAKNYGDVTENFDFSKGDPLTSGVCTYDYDTAKNGTTRSGMQTVPGWTENKAGNNSEGNGRSGGLYAINSGAWLGGSSYKAPTAGPNDETSGNVLGIIGVNGNEATCTATKSLEKGIHVVTIPVYNAGGTATITNKLAIASDGTTLASSSNTTYAEKEWTTETLTFSLEEAADVSITLGFKCSSGSSSAPHLFYGGLTFSQEETATAEDYEALNAAIAAAEEKTLGFDEGDYAPYNNVEAIEALTAANAIDQTVLNTKESVTSATTALTEATWTVNTEEVNAFYDGTFALAEANGAPAGWTMTNNTLGGEYHSRVLSNNDKLAGFNDTKSAFFIRFDGTNSDRGSMYYYGNTTGYTMPLKGNAYYALTVDYGGWGTSNKTLRVNVKGPEDFSATYKDLTTSVDVSTGKEESIVNPLQHSYIFKTGESDGNYTISFQAPGDDTNEQADVVSNLKLFRAGILTREGKYKNGTICYPYTLAPAEGTSIYEIAGRSSDSKTIYFSKAITETEAGKPYIYEAKQDGDGYVATFYYNTKETNVSKPVEGANQLNGTFTYTTALSNCTSGKSVYIVQKGKWVLVPETYWKSYNMTANTAYIADMDAVEEATSDASAKAMTVVYDDTTTGINGATLNSENGDIYNLRGQKVSRTQKGIYIQNGRKVVIK